MPVQLSIPVVQSSVGTFPIDGGCLDNRVAQIVEVRGSTVLAKAVMAAIKADSLI